MINKRRALISVSDKKNLVDFAAELVSMNYDIVSTGGTARLLRDKGLPVTEASEITGFPEILGGRVKTLHPLIHGAILACPDLDNHAEELKQRGITPFDLVVVNLYPFEKTVESGAFSHQSAIENIDIGGPTMIRAAAKNHAYVAVVVNPACYDSVLMEIREKGEVGREMRVRLAAEAFRHTAAYDGAIASYFNDLPEISSEPLPDNYPLVMRKVQGLRYGENPQQSGAFYRPSGKLQGLAAARQLQGKELSFNNLNDLNTAWMLVKEFAKPTAVAVKHASPCGVGSALIPADAYRFAHDADPVSIFGGVVVLNRTIDGETAEELVKIFLEVVAAPHFTDEALNILALKKDMRLLLIPEESNNKTELDLKKVYGGFLLQTEDHEEVDISRGEVVTERAPTLDEWRDLNFAQTVVKHVRSNAIVIAREEQTIGIGAGQTSRIGAARIALSQAGQSSMGAVLASDAFFPFPDTVEEAANSGITALVQPGGSLKDEESIDLCNRYNLAMVFTGRRYFRH